MKKHSNIGLIGKACKLESEVEVVKNANELNAKFTEIVNILEEHERQIEDLSASQKNDDRDYQALRASHEVLIETLGFVRRWLCGNEPKVLKEKDVLDSVCKALVDAQAVKL